MAQLKRTLGRLCLTAVLTILLGTPLWQAFAQQQSQPGAKAQPEGTAEVKTHDFGPDSARYLTVIQTDKPIYREGETVYVRGVVLHHAKRTPLQVKPNLGNGRDGLLKVVGPKGAVLANLGIKAENGMWGARWEVPHGTAGGEFQLEVSYPQLGLPPAQRNFDVRAYRAPRLKSQIKFVRDGYGPGDKVSATLEVERAEGGVPVNAPVLVDVRVDGVQVHQSRSAIGVDGRCRVSFELPEAIERGEGTLALIIQDGGVTETAAKTIPILLQAVDMQFYPEGGDLVAGLQSRVYFEAFTPAGKPADLAGRVVDDRGRVMTEFRSEHEGRGRLTFTPLAGRSYHAEITKPTGITKTVVLPQVAKVGATIRAAEDVYTSNDAIALTIASTKSQDVTLVIRKREREIAKKTVRAKRGGTIALLNLGDQPHADGVLVVTAYDPSGKALAERLIYREPSHHVHVEIVPESGAGFVPGGTVRMKVKTTGPDGEPLPAIVGVSVTDESVLEMIDKREQTPLLPVAVLLESEVFDLADAHVYLDPDNDAAPTAVDLLLGVQGWRRFALIDPNAWLMKFPQEGRQVLAQAVPLGPWGGFGGGIGGGDAKGAFFGGPAPIAPGALPVPAAPAAPAAPGVPGSEVAGPEPGVDDNLKKAGDKPMAAPAIPEAELDRANDAAKEIDGAIKDEAVGQKDAVASGPQRGGRARGLGREKVDGAAKSDEMFNQNMGIGGGGPGGWRALPPDTLNLSLFRYAQQNQLEMQSLMTAPLMSVREYRHQVRPNRKPSERVDFAETLYWNVALETNAEGVAEFEFGLSDAVTSFRVKADAVDALGGLGAATTPIESVEPFYLEPKLPLEVTMGDLIQTPLAIVNATNQEMNDIRVDLSTEGLEANASLEPFVVEAGGRIRKRVNIHVGDYVGEAKLQVVARSGEYRDQVTRTLQVAPLGFPYEHGSGALLTANGVFASQIEIPTDLVPGSVKATATVYPTPLATMTKSLERLIREPNGCFEQTSSTTYPLVMAQQYFKSHQGVDPVVIQRSAATLAKGYDRLIGFESPSGGFEWFGKDPGHDALTAYGLLEFTDMSMVHAVDQALLDRTREWLMKQRDGKGGYVRKTNTLHTWLAEPEVAFSYNTWALLEAGTPPSDLAKEVAWAANVAESTDNSYVIALGANIVQLAGEQDVANRLLDKLSGLQQQDGSVKGATVSVVGSGGEALTIETTSLAMLAWMKHRSHVEQVEKGIKYLAEICKGGRFGSTQSTILALRGIVEFDARHAKPTNAGAITLWVDGKQIGDAFSFDADTHGALSLPDFADSLAGGVNQVELRMENGADMPVTIQWSYNALTPDSSKQCQLDLEVNLADSTLGEGASTDAEVIVVNRSEEKVPSPMAIIGIPGGLEVRHDQLKEAVEEGLIAAYEVRGREVILYWRALDGEQRVRVPLSLIAAVPGRYTAPASRAYLYYTDEYKIWTPGLQATVRPKK